MWEWIKKIFKHFFTQVVFPGAIWDSVKNFFVLVFSIWGLKKSGEMWNILATGGNIPLHSRILLIFCASICALNIVGLLIYLVIGIRIYRKQKAEREQLDTEREQLDKEREQLDAERTQLAADKEKMNSGAIVPAFPPLDSRYKINNAEIEFFFEDREHIILRYAFSFCVKDESLDSIHHTMIWTGDSYAGSQLDQMSIQRGYQLEETESSASIFKITVTIPGEHHINDTGNYCFETKVTDRKHQMMPFLSHLIKCPTEQLSLKITAPQDIIQSCKQMVTADATCDFILSGPESVKPERVGNLFCYQHKFTNLDLLRYYRLNWVFTDHTSTPIVTQNVSSP